MITEAYFAVALLLGVLLGLLVGRAFKVFAKMAKAQITGSRRSGGDKDLAPFIPGLPTFTPPPGDDGKIRLYQKHGCTCGYTGEERFCQVQHP